MKSVESGLMLETLLSLDVEPEWKEVDTKAIVHWRCGKAGQHLLPGEGHRPWALGVSGAMGSGRGTSGLHTVGLSLLPFLFQSSSEPHMSREEVRGAEF